MLGLYWGYIGRMETKMEATVIGLYGDYRVYSGVVLG